MAAYGIQCEDETNEMETICAVKVVDWILTTDCEFADLRKFEQRRRKRRRRIEMPSPILFAQMKSQL